MFNHLVYQQLLPNNEQNIFSVKDNPQLSNLAELVSDFIASIPTVLSTTVSSISGSSETQHHIALVSASSGDQHPQGAAQQTALPTLSLTLAPSLMYPR